jgi:prophage tail gpP-like protein
MVWPNPEEVAILRVNGVDYKDWESVMVRNAKKERPPYHARFTCSEGSPIAKNWAVLQIKPGDKCTIILAGIPAFNGTVETRQVFYDAKRHYIEIQCATFTELQTSSIIHPTMEWKNKTFKQIGQDVLNHFGIKLTFEGGSEPNYKFPRVSAHHGESVQDFLDVLGRSLSQETGVPISFTSNVEGEFVVITGPSGGSDTVEEGKNILEGREIIYRPSAASSAPAILGQGPGSAKKWGAPVTSLPFFTKTAAGMFPKSPPSAVVFNELPTSEREVLKGRGTSESMFSLEDQITVFVTVQGWLRFSRAGLWYRNQEVNVKSPMLMMKGNEELRARAVTFMQDNRSGTRTTLELRNAAAMKGFAPDIQYEQP